MGYILRDQITITRPIVFLCGPYCVKGDAGDRRNILRKFFSAEYKNSVLPLIIDDFLTIDNIKEPDVNIQLLEEIFATISYKSYIFLDTLSSAAELGLFMNHAFSNRIVAYLPKESDIYNKKNAGYFVKDVILKMNSSQAKCLVYRPSIQRKAIATDYVVEQYGFIKNVIPDNIANDILNDARYREKRVLQIKLIKGTRAENDKYSICYLLDGNKVKINIPLSILFYVVTSLMYELFPEKLVTNKQAQTADFNFAKVLELTKETFSNFMIQHNIPFRDISFDTDFSVSFDSMVYHIVTFCYVYHCFSTYKGIRLVDRHMDSVIDNYIEIKGKNPIEVFGITGDDYSILCKCVNNQLQYTSNFPIFNGRKKRELVKYSDDENGNTVRKIHQTMMENLQKIYSSNEYSFAYKKGLSIKDCVQIHLDSISFVKYDVSKFFNSIDAKILAEQIEKVFDIDPAYEGTVKNIVNSVYIDNKLPLGLVISPLLSDIYMQEFDFVLGNYCKKKSLKYSRYADDIMVSSEIFIDEQTQTEIENVIVNNLDVLKLKLNIKKKRQIDFTKNGQHMKYIGISIVYHPDGNVLSVGRNYIYGLVNEFYEYMDAVNEDNVSENQKEYIFYEKRRIAGKIAFIRAIEGKDGLEKIRRRLGKNAHFLSEEQL